MRGGILPLNDIDKADPPLASHAEKRPACQSVKSSIDCSWDAEIEEGQFARRQSAMAAKTISINRALFLTLWAAVVAQRLGFAEDEDLTVGKAVRQGI
jgi:hypothetical protein